MFISAHRTTNATMTSPSPLTLITILYAYPFLNILYFLLASLVSAWTLQTLSLEVKTQHPRQQVILLFMFGVVCEYIIQALLLSVYSFMPTTSVVNHNEIVYLLFSALVWGIQYIVLAESKSPVWYPYYINWATATLLEITLLVIPAIAHKVADAFDCILMSLQFLRICNLIALLVYFVSRDSRDVGDNDTEGQSLLTGQDTTGYGATVTAPNNAASTERDDKIAEDQHDARLTNRLIKAGNWWDYAKEFHIFLPYLWPTHSPRLQCQAVLLGLCPLATNILNLLTPRQLGAVVDTLATGDITRSCIQGAIYGLLSFINSDACIGWVQYYLWKPLQQYAYESINVAAHSHVMGLSWDFHENKQPEDIHHDVFQGQSITELVDVVCFKLGPMLIDFLLVTSYLYYLLGPYMALNWAFTSLFYLYETSKLLQFVAPTRRDYIRYYRKEWRSAHSTLRGWREAWYSNNTSYEHNRYASNVKEQLRLAKRYGFTMKLVSAGQAFILTFGFLGGCFLAIYQVVHKIRSPGDFVVYVTYWHLLKGQLSFLSNTYKDISHHMMDAERLLEIFERKPSIYDKEDAKPLKLTKVEVRLINVSFAYSSQNEAALKNITFGGAKGLIIAIVGETGSGKTTIFKLLTRLYDVTSGSIEIDGQDIRYVTLESLHANIGIVPQDPHLFEDSIISNLRYFRWDASDQEIYSACKAAGIHEKIMSFPDGYDTKVGSSGYTLSGGEKQRLAIAQVILKRSKILLLDEPTSAVDTATEQIILETFRTMHGECVTFIIAHRLSTIRDADSIVVMSDGGIVEVGSHEDLLHAHGQYYDYWKIHLEKQEKDLLAVQYIEAA